MLGSRSTRPNMPFRLVFVALFLMALAAAVAGPASAVESGFVTLGTLTGNGAGKTGTAPYGPVVRYPADGSLWGTASTGGTANLGTIFKYVPSSGAITTIINFTGPNGSKPFAGLKYGSDGNFYGVTEFGGTDGLGTVFKLTPSGTLTTLYSFKGQGDGSDPYGALVQAPNGILYGSTLADTVTNGVPSGSGTLFSITTTGILTTLHVFHGTDGANPESAMTVGNDGNLYGVTTFGGQASSTVSNEGVVFQLTSAGTYTVLHNFAGGADGGNPECQLLLASDGTLYGTTNSSDLSDQGQNPPPPAPNYGTIFNITTGGVFTASYSFTAVDVNGINSDGAFPSGSLVQLTDGSIYGTLEGGTSTGDGGIFRFQPSTSTETVVHAFTGGADGLAPVGGLKLGNGDMFGTTSGGTSHNDPGTIFEFFGTPVITNVTPNYAVVGSSVQIATINGSNFNTTGVLVTASGTPLPVASVTPTEVVIGIPSNLLTTPRTLSIVVANDPNVPLSNAVNYTVGAASGVPTITSLSPTSTAAQGPAFTLTIHGTNFDTAGMDVNFGGTVLTPTTITSTLLTVTIPASSINLAGTAHVSVSNVGNYTASNVLNFTVFAPVPIITSLDPGSITAGSPGFTLTITGSKFLTNPTVKFGSTVLAVVSRTSTVITVTVPASLVTTAGNVPVTVTNAGNTTVSNVATFVVYPPPHITSLSPSTIVAGAATFTLTINGSQFNTNGVLISFGSYSIAATHVTPTQITATVPAADVAAPGTYSVVVTDAGNPVKSNAVPFTVNAAFGAAMITSISPTSGVAGLGFNLTINGTGFRTSGETVTFGGTVLAVQSATPTKIVATVPAALVTTPGTYGVAVANNGGTLISNTVDFKVIPDVPHITSLSPTSTTQGAAAFTLTINGSSFFSGATVKFGNTALTVLSVTSTKITVTVPASSLTAIGSFPVVVTNASQPQLSNTVSFTVTTRPTIHSFSGAGIQMISLPYDYPGINPDTVLNLSVKLAAWNPLSNVYDVDDGLASDLRLGQGYWIRIGSTPAVVNMPGTKASSTTPFTITLQAGWNMIGDPFIVAAPLSSTTYQIGTSSAGTLSQAIAAGLISPALYTYPAGATNYTVIDSTDSLVPYAGYWIHTGHACTMSIPPPAGS